MDTQPKVPSLYSLETLEAGQDPRAEARLRAAAGADPATLLWTPGDDNLVCAVVLAPDSPLEQATLVNFVGAVALGDAIGQVVQAGVDVTFEWPNRVLANGGLVAEVAVDAPEGASGGAVPDWLVASFVLSVMPHRKGDFDRDDLSHTTLYEEGSFDVTPAAMLEVFARYFLNWVNRWQEDGFAVVRTSWVNRLPDRGERIGVEVAGEWITGRLHEVTDAGDLVLDCDGTTRVFELAAFL